ncbi:exported hypothetical protein [Burkholderia ambifaria]
MRIRSRRRAALCAALVTSAGLALATSRSAHAGDANLNVYNWSQYIASDTVPNFEKQTGIKVRYDSYDSDDTLQTKLLAGSSGYDIVVPTSNYLAQQIQAGVYQKLDKSKLPNLANLDPVLMKMIAKADPGNQYGVPWAWGTTGIGYNVDAVKKRLGENAPTDSWALLFDPANAAKLKGCGISARCAGCRVRGRAAVPGQGSGEQESGRLPGRLRRAEEDPPVRDAVQLGRLCGRSREQRRVRRARLVRRR